jgi:hypothetical protein
MEKRALPPIDFPLFGLDRAWSGPRWLDFVDGNPGEPVDWVWLGHGDRHGPMRGHPWTSVGNLRPAADRPVAAGRSAYERELAWSGLFALINQLSPELEPHDRGRFWRNSLI